MNFFGIFFWDFFCWIVQILFKVTKVSTKVTKVTTGPQKWPKMGQNSIIRSFSAQRAKEALAEGQSPPQELEVGLRSGPYLLVPTAHVSYLLTKFTYYPESVGAKHSLSLSPTPTH